MNELYISETRDIAHIFVKNITVLTALVKIVCDFLDVIGF
jgi:hypothetical protein